MAKRAVTEIVDDIDGTPITDTSGQSVNFSVDGVDYTIDLKNAHAKQFRKAFDYYVEHATRLGKQRRTSSAAARASSGKRSPEVTRTIRQWAADAGYDVSDRGRIPADVEAAYNAAH